MAVTDWLLRIEGVNLDATVYNTNELSVIRGSSLVLEAFGYELDEIFLKLLANPTIRTVYHSSAGAVYVIESTTQSGASAVQLAAMQRLRHRQVQGLVTPPFWDIRNGRFAPFLNLPSEHLTFVSAVVEMRSGETFDNEASLKRPMNVALAICRREQMQQPALPLSPKINARGSSARERGLKQCLMDATQQVGDENDLGAYVWMAEGQKAAAHSLDPGKRGAQRRLFSRRSAHLRKYGRDARQQVYQHILGASRMAVLADAGLFDRFVFAESFDDIYNPAGRVASESEQATGQTALAKLLPPSLPGKLAVLYIDGAGFTKLAQERPKDMPAAMREVMGETFKALLLRFLDGAQGEGLEADHWRRERRVLDRAGAPSAFPLRLETFVAGGDDLILILPAFHAIDLAHFVLKILDAEVKKHDATKTATFRAGLAIAPAGSPFRRLRGLAYQLMNDAKAATFGSTVSALSIQTVESLDLRDSDDSLETIRDNYRVQGEREQDTGAALRWTLDDHDQVIKGLRALKTHMSRGAMLRIAEALDAGTSTGEHLAKALDLHANRQGKSMPLDDFKAALRKPSDTLIAQWIRSAVDLWDYVDPLAGDRR